jgi:hypothetical protein
LHFYKNKKIIQKLKQMKIQNIKQSLLTLVVMFTIGCITATAQDTAVIRIDKNKAKEAYQSNSDGRKTTATQDGANRRATYNDNAPARRQTATQNSQERKAAAADGAVTDNEAQALYQSNSAERRTNAANAAPSRAQTLKTNSSNRRTQFSGASANRRGSIIH